MTYLGTKFEVATSNGLGDAFTRKYITKCCRVSSTVCDLFRFEVATSNGLGVDAFTRNVTEARLDRIRHEINIIWVREGMMAASIHLCKSLNCLCP